MIVAEKVPEEEILLAFAQSEMFSRRWADGLASHLEEALAERVRYSPRSEWPAEDRAALVDGVRAFRPPLLDPLLRLGVVWWAASLVPSDLADLRAVSTREFQGLAPDGRLATLVDSLEKGRDTPDADFSGGFRRLKNAYSPAKMQGRPCLVAKAKDGPYTVVEGLTRLAVLQSRWSAGKPVPDPLEAYLGLTDRLGEWGFAAVPDGGITPTSRPGPASPVDRSRSP